MERDAQPLSRPSFALKHASQRLPAFDEVTLLDYSERL